MDEEFEKFDLIYLIDEFGGQKITERENFEAIMILSNNLGKSGYHLEDLEIVDTPEDDMSKRKLVCTKKKIKNLT